MRRFADLYWSLEEASGVNQKLKLLQVYFTSAPEEDMLHMLSIYFGKRAKVILSLSQLKAYALEFANVAPWMFEECLMAAGDLSETIALILPAPASGKGYALSEIFQGVNRVFSMDDREKKKFIFDCWVTMDTHERFVFNKLVSGGFRPGLSTTLISEALSKVMGLDQHILTCRLLSKWTPEKVTFNKLVHTEVKEETFALPYKLSSYQLADIEMEELRAAGLWRVDYKWKGMRVELVRRGGHCFLWNQEEELLTACFPELNAALNNLPDGTVLDGELIAFKNGKVLSYTLFKKRLLRKKPSPALLEEVPVVFVVYDLMEVNGVDIREMSLFIRREKCELLFRKFPSPFLMLSETVAVDELSQIGSVFTSRKMGVPEGFLIRNSDAPYNSDVNPALILTAKKPVFTMNAVLIYAQVSSGTETGHYTAYTFALWKEGQLMPVVKLSALHLPKNELNKVYEFIKGNTIEKFGPVRSVRPSLLFRIGFEAVYKSKRHKSGIAIEAPIVLNLLQNESPEETSQLSDLEGMIISE